MSGFCQFFIKFHPQYDYFDMLVGVGFRFSYTLCKLTMHKLLNDVLDPEKFSKDCGILNFTLYSLRTPFPFWGTLLYHLIHGSSDF